MENKKKLIISIIIAVILVAIVVLLIFQLINLKNKGKELTQVNNNENFANEAIIENNTLDNVIENDTEEENNNNVNNVTAEEEEKNTNKDTEEIPQSVVEEEKNNKEKAIDIVKNAWGEDNNVYFSFDNIDSNGKYRICVRDKETTHAISWYIVDVSEGTYVIE